ncbi:MAG: hypothetical protein H0V01_06315 [Bacteroidetes bacterium]|nr:hypothetical protein [Bacteroidota bacterium]HET6244293.1 hypothetical protein [Bacteroidia bacterium]
MANRIFILIIGVLLGIILGGGIFWFLSGFSGKNIFIVNQQTSKNEKDTFKSGKSYNGNNKELNRVEKSLEKINLAKDISDTITLERTESSDLTKQSIVDTNLLATNLDSLYYSPDNFEEQIVVKKDELLSSKNINLIDLNLKPVTIKFAKDSLAQITSGIKEPPALSTINVEFWKSPINYKGYKMSRNKLVIFGLQESENPKIIKLSDNLFLKNFDKVYRIQKNTDFRSLELVTDPEILNLLNLDS